MNRSPRPLFVLLSQLLVDYTDRFDAAMAGELGKNGGERLPSLAMWADILQFIPDAGIGMRELRSLSGLAAPTVKTMVDCLKRHGWITFREADRIRLTRRGANARRAFAKANRSVERGWKSSWGAKTFTALRATLETASAELGDDYPRYPMPAAHRGAFPRGE